MKLWWWNDEEIGMELTTDGIGELRKIKPSNNDCEIFEQLWAVRAGFA